MIELDAFDWFLIALDFVCLVGFAWSIWYAKKLSYPHTQRDAAIPATLILSYTIILILYVLGVLN